MAEDPHGQGFNPLEVLVKGLIDGLESMAGPFPPDTEEPQGGPAPGRPRPRARRPTPTLDRYGVDLTEAARAGRLDPVVGRDAEVDQVLEVLSRRTKNNPVLIGDPGVGKTAIVEGIAARIAEGAVPETLRDRRIVALDLAGMVAGTRYRGDFEQRFTSMIDEVLAADREVVLFLDELHTVIGAGSAEGAPMDAGSMLKPALARGGLQLVGATTVEEYRRHLERDGALERRFQPILVQEPSVTDTVSILRGLRDRYEAHHRVRIADPALEAAARLSDRYLTDRFLPDKAIDLIDRAAARVRLGERGGDRAGERGGDRAGERLGEQAGEQAGERGTASPELPEVGATQVAEVLASLTGIPVAQLTAVDRQRLLRLEELLGERVVGQRDAVQAVADAVRAGRAGLTHPDRPVGSFLFLGPTGVGKTELARALASALFGAEDRLIRFDMSEFGERHTVSRLVGAPPGYLGHDQAGQLTDAVRRTPYTVVLLDEIEKAHPDVTDVLLQVLDAGRLTDARGRTANFANTVVILTSNLGAEALLVATAQGRSPEEIREPLMAGVRGRFRPEFLNRVDEIVLFSGLGHPELRAITELLLAQTRDRLRDQDIELSMDPAAVDWLARRGHRPELGARPLRRTIARELERQLSRMLIAGELCAGQRVVASVGDSDELLELRVSGPAD